MVKPFKKNINSLTVKNKYYRKVLFTTNELQLVLMCLESGEEIGMESHLSTTQFIRVEEGSGYAIVSGKKYRLKDDDAIVIPSRSRHNIVAGKEGMKLYTIYSPPEHAPNTKEKYKIE